jgi:hypothetical protein
MNELILCIFLFAGFFTIFKLAYDQNAHFKWFHSLKEGDRILVRIYSENCECAREATVVSEPHGKFLEAKIDDNILSRCKECAELNSKNNKGQLTCWNQMILFDLHNCTKIKDKSKNYKSIR